MSDSDYEIVETSSIQFAGRSRKPKYTHKLWEKDDAVSVAKYYAAAHRIHCRRNNTDDSPYSHYIDKREEYVNWWLQNSIHLISIEQIRFEQQDEIIITIGESDSNLFADAIESDDEIIMTIGECDE